MAHYDDDTPVESERFNMMREMTETDSTLTGQHFDADKLRMELIPPELLYAVAKILTYGASKYAPNNWLGGMDWSRLCGSIERHYYAWKTGEDNDPESGLPHLAHAACNIAFLLTYTERNLGHDDRRKTRDDKPRNLAHPHSHKPGRSAADCGCDFLDDLLPLP